MTTNTIKYTYLSRPYSFTALQLGTLTTSTHDPVSSSLQAPTPLFKEDYSRQDDPLITVLGTSHLSYKHKSQIAHVFLGDLDKTETRNLKIGAHHGFIYSLYEPRAWFRKLCGKEDMRRWLEVSFEEKKRLWMVVGLKTLVDADLVAHPSPVQNRVELAGDGPRDEVDDKGEDVQQEWEFPGERIYAVCYVPVDLSFFESSECSPVRGPRWESHSRVLDGEGEVQVVEAVVEDVGEGGR
jgi:hypothetical protein